MPTTLEHRSTVLWGTAILLLTAAVYAPSLRNGFTYDDRYVAKAESSASRPNRLVSELRPLPEYFLSHYSIHHKPAGPEYRPVTIYSFALVYHFAGRPLSRLNPLGESLPQHAVNLLLHLLATGLVFMLVRQLGAGRRAALVAMGIFGLHAIHSEAVVSLVGRSELFTFVFGLGATLVLLRATAGGISPRLRDVALANALLLLAVFSKEQAVAWPFALFAILLARDAADSGRWPDWPALRRPLGTAALAGTLPLIAFICMWAVVLADLGELPPPDPMVNPLAHTSTWSRLLTAVMVSGYGAALTALPFRLSSDYGLAVFPLLESALDPRFWISALLLSGLLAAGLASLRGRPLCFVAAFVFFGFSFIVSNLLVVIGTSFGERLYYTPALAVSLVAASFCQRPCRAFALADRSRSGSATTLAPREAEPRMGSLRASGLWARRLP